MPKFKEGERVQVRAREAHGKEAHEGRYAPHLANATGAVLKVYSPQEIAVELDLDSLPEAIRERHAEQQTRMHERWLNSLSEEARNRLTDDEKTFRLRYVVLLAEDDLLPLKAKAAPTAAPKAVPRTKPEPTQPPKASRKAQLESETPRRPTPEELEKLEEQYLKARKRRA
ncbi:MAG: hypothetical protein CFK49_08930 [Armatimonadetes bacterium JP3_11]|nr:MAG: hypothetical protein CFK48_05395 [Armatimonadetes bacterium CP1_7O]OYT74326.1 MAG: hypothetical protein CFK49_08930 [Armatimonadetes bacterium JP3_11]